MQDPGNKDRKIIRDFLSTVPVEERLQGLSLEQRLSGLTPEERLKALEAWVKGMTPEQLERLKKLLQQTNTDDHSPPE
jgi:hypothetical protein